jgi:hypothetical protein
MDLGASNDDDGGEQHQQQQQPRALPPDLPQSLDDNRHRPAESYVPETEMYDGWQGEQLDDLTREVYPSPANARLIQESHSSSRARY